MANDLKFPAIFSAGALFVFSQAEPQPPLAATILVGLDGETIVQTSLLGLITGVEDNRKASSVALESWITHKLSEDGNTLLPLKGDN